MPGNPLVRFDEGRVGRAARCRPLSYSTEKTFLEGFGQNHFSPRRKVRKDALRDSLMLRYVYDWPLVPVCDGFA